MKHLSLLLLLTAASVAVRAQQPFATHYYLDSFYSISSIGQHTVQVGNAFYVSYNVQRQPSLDTTTSILAKLDGDGRVVFARRMNHERANTLTMMRTSDNHLLIYHSRQATGSPTVTYVTKMDTALNVVWSVSGISGGLGLAERSGDYVVYGGTNTGTSAGGSLRVARLNKATGALLGQSSTALIGAGGAPDFAHPLANGNHILTGLTNGTGSGNAHSFIASVTPTGGAAWATSLENVVGQNYEFSAAVEDGAGNVYVAGRFEDGSGNITTSGILVKLSPAGNLIFARRFTMPPVSGFAHNVAFYTMTLSGGSLRLFGRAVSSNSSIPVSIYRLVQLRLDTTGVVTGQKLLNASLAPFSTQNLFGGAQSPYFETPDGRLVFTTTSFRECVSNRQNIFIAQTAAGTNSTGCDSTAETAVLVDSAHTVSPTNISISSNSIAQVVGAGLTTLDFVDRSLTRTRYCDCARITDGTASMATTESVEDNPMLVPNPTTGELRVEGFRGQLTTLRFTDVAGRLVWSVQDYRGEVLSLPSFMPPGLYAVQILPKDGSQVVRRLVVR